jgi:IS1 family transposase/transposase-like protein
MCYEAITCPRCSSRHVRKNGKTLQRKQRFQCTNCRRQFITAYTNLGCLPEIRWLIIVLTLNGCGVRDLQRALHVSPNTVLKVIRQEAAAVPEPDVPRRIRTLELDEFWSFAGSKQQPRWTWYGFDRERRRVVAFVNGRRTDESGRSLRRKLGRAQVNTFRTDKWPTYGRYFPGRRHHTGKGGTSHIERNHLNFRTRIKRLQRRTICYSRSPELHDAVIKLFIHYSNSKHHHF